MSFLINPYILGTAGDGGDFEEIVIPDLITTNMLLHIDIEQDVYSDAGVTPAVNNDFVRQIYDQEATPNNIEQSTGTLQLQYKTDIFNKKPFLLSLSGDYMTPSTPFNFSGGTIYATFKKNLEASDCMIIGGDSNACITNFSNGDSILFDGTSNVNVPTGHFTEHAVYAFVWDFGNTFEVFKNGISEGSISASGIGAINNVKAFGRGAETAASSHYFGDLLIYTDIHTPTQIADNSLNLMNETYGVPTYTGNPRNRMFLVHHFRADLSARKTGDLDPVNNETVQLINDLTHNDVDGTVSSTEPKYFSSGAGTNSRPYVKLGGGTGVVNLSPTITIERTQDFTIFAVVKKDTASDVLVLYGGDVNVSLFSDYSDGNQYYVSPTNNTSVPSMGTDWCLISAVYDASANTINVYKNGTLLGTDSAWNVGGAYTINRLFNRGTVANGSTANAYVAESQLLLQKMSDADRQAEETKLNSYYGLY